MLGDRSRRLARSFAQFVPVHNPLLECLSMMRQFEVLRCASSGVSSASVALFTLETPDAGFDDVPRV